MGTFLTLLVNGLAQGSLVFLMAAGLSIILGLMGVVNFSHGTLFLWGGYSFVWSYYAIRFKVVSSMFADAVPLNEVGNYLHIQGISLPEGASLPFMYEFGIFIAALAIAVTLVFVMGIIFEKLFINRVYGNVPAQILITLGIQVVFTDIVRLIWGPNPFPVDRPPFLNGVSALGSARIVHYNLFLIAIGLLTALIIQRILTKTKIGMVIRAGLQSPEHVRAIGINIKAYFMFVFAAGSALAGLGGALYMPLVGSVVSTAGMNNQILAFIVVVVGGLGSFIGSFLGSIFLGLMGVAIAMFIPAFAVVANVLVMALVLMFKPDGLFPDGIKIPQIKLFKAAERKVQQ
ncbi:MAG: branched-chain amino acid ABC transporter permease [Spirochaetaceae bacterium]|nr:MAG: branched-chain amino acid ABC transporter permease [Spirochaetaceae bacterium]